MIKKLSELALRSPLIKLSETDTLPKRIQVIRTGTFQHPQYGKMVITKAHLSDFVRTFNEKVRGIDISLDFAHESDKEAAAWITQLYLEDDGNSLFADVDWTKPGTEKVQGKEYRYVSADFHLNYQDPESLKFHGPTLLGAGLTNRPFIKKMEPVVQLSEFNGGNSNMDLQQALARIAELEAQLKAAAPAPAAGQEELMADMQKKMQGMQAQCAELEKENKVFKAEKEEAAKAAQLAERKGQFDKMLSEGKAVEAQRDPWMANDLTKFAELQMDPKSKKLSDATATGGSENDSDDVQEKILKLAETMVKEKKSPDLSSALSAVLSDPENKKLAEQYNNIEFSMKEAK